MVRRDGALDVVEAESDFLLLLERLDLLFGDARGLLLPCLWVVPRLLDGVTLLNDDLVLDEVLKEGDEVLLAQILARLAWHHLRVG